MKPKRTHGEPPLVPDWMEAEPPAPCGLKVGDSVTYTNPQGVKFQLTVRGFVKDPREHSGRSVYIFTDAYWFPVHAKDCQLNSTR